VTRDESGQEQSIEGLWRLAREQQQRIEALERSPFPSAIGSPRLMLAVGIIAVLSLGGIAYAAWMERLP
jgi:hypothetical protein